MDKPLIPAKTSGLMISADNPFRDEIAKWQQQVKTATRTTTGEGYKHTRITIIEQSEYYPGRYTKMYHSKLKEILNDIGPYEALLFIHIALNIDYESEQVLIDYKEVAMNRKTLSAALLELTARGVIRKVEGKKQWYWVNVTMLIIGNVSKENDWSAPGAPNGSSE
jgi:hypothetical protein